MLYLQQAEIRLVLFCQNGVSVYLADAFKSSVDLLPCPFMILKKSSFSQFPSIQTFVSLLKYYELNLPSFNFSWLYFKKMLMC